MTRERNGPVAVGPRSRPLRILFAIGSLEVGGAENQLALLAGRLSAAGHRVWVFSFQDGGALEGRLRQNGVNIAWGGMNSGDLRRRPWKLVAAQIRFFKAVMRSKPDVVHAFLPLITFLTAAAGKICGVSSIVTGRRALGTHQDRYPVLFVFDLFANLLSDCITVNSAGVGKDLIRRERIGGEKIALVYNGVETDRFCAGRVDREELRRQKELPASAPIAVTVANLIPYKGHAELIRAAKTVVEQVPEARFLVVGEDRGIQRGLQESARVLGVADRILFFGGRSDVSELLAACDLFVLPSHEEGFCNSLLEAMAAGLPVVATAVGGNPEAVADGKTGWLVPARDADALAERIVDLLKHPDRAGEWGRRGQETVAAKFSVEKMVARHLALYRGRFQRNPAEKAKEKRI